MRGKSELAGGLPEARVREIREHFLKTGYQRMFEQVRRKWESIGRVGGKIRLEGISEEERRCITGLLGVACQADGVVEVRLADLDKRLRDSRWAIGLEELIPLLTGQPLVSKKQRKEQQASAWDSFCRGLLAECLREETRRWWENVHAGGALGSKTVKQLFDQDSERAQTVAVLCLRALDELPCWKGTYERLPVFANRLSGDPHALDSESLTGRLLYQAICDLVGVVPENTSEWKREVLQEVGLSTDELASYVTVLGLATLPDDPWHAFFERANAVRIPLLLPLAFFQEKVAWQTTKLLYVVENPSVFQSIIDLWPKERALPPIVCTSGQPSVAALRLLDAFAAMGAQICYSGDFDWKGIEMACSLQKRYGAFFSPWRMGAGDYLACSLGTAFEEEQLKGLLALEVPWDQELIGVMAERKRKIYQESLVEKLLEDLL
jgi:uncharacterized protein (TIGR02679 family)